MIEAIKRVFKRKPKGVVYFRVKLDGHFIGVTKDQPAKPWIMVEGMTLEEAAGVIPRIDWHTVPMNVRASLELGDQCLTLSRADALQFLKV